MERERREMKCAYRCSTEGCDTVDRLFLCKIQLLHGLVVGQVALEVKQANEKKRCTRTVGGAETSDSGSCRAPFSALAPVTFRKDENKDPFAGDECTQMPSPMTGIPDYAHIAHRGDLCERI